MLRRHSDLRGRQAFNSRKQAKRYLVVTNGKVTEFTYFSIVNELSRNVIKPRFINSDISGLVDEAQRLNSGSDYDGAFVVCDIDDQLGDPVKKRNLLASIKRADKLGIQVTLSHESFEAWLLCHAIKVPAEARDRAVAHRLAQDNGLVKGGNGKVVVRERITHDSIKKAAREAKRLRELHGADVVKNSPTTNVDKIIDLAGI